MTILLLTAAAMCGVIALALWHTRERDAPFDAELDTRLSEEFWQVDVEYQRRWGNE